MVPARARRLSLLGAVAALAAGMLAWLAWGLYGPHGNDALPVPPTVQHSGPPRSAAVAKAGPARVPASVPVRIVIPSIGVNAPVTPKGLDQRRALELPPLTAHNLAGWYDKSSRPGQTGPSIIAGHVDSATGPSVFINVRELKPGDEILIQGASHHTVTFKVQWVQEAPKNGFPTKAVYGHVPYPALRLITCGGPFDPVTGHYRDNIIVYAAMK